MNKYAVRIWDMSVVSPFAYGKRYLVEFNDGSEGYYNTIKEMDFEFRPWEAEGR